MKSHVDAEAFHSRFRLTPLSIVAMFLSLSEAVAGIAAIQASGGLQIALGIFIIVFPFAIACAFFVILWYRPYVFYPPNEYGEKTDVKQYVEAMQYRSAKEADVLDHLDDKIMQALRANDTISDLAELASREKHSKQTIEKDEIFGGIASRAAQAIRESFVIIEAGPEFGDRAGRYSFAYKPTDSVYRVGNAVYFLLTPMVKAFTLGTKWALIDKETGQRMKEFESEWSRGKTEEEDTREVQSVGVKPGMVLKVVYL